MHAQLVHGHMQLALAAIASVLEQTLQKLDERCAIECFVNHHPVRFALVVDAGDHAELVARATDRIHLGRFHLGCLAVSTHIGVDHGCFVESVNFSLLCFGLFLNLWVLCIEPLLQRFGGAARMPGCTGMYPVISIDRLPNL